MKGNYKRQTERKEMAPVLYVVLFFASFSSHLFFGCCFLLSNTTPVTRFFSSLRSFCCRTHTLLIGMLFSPLFSIKKPPTPALINYFLLQSLLSTHTTRTHKQHDMHSRPSFIKLPSPSPPSPILLHYFSRIFSASPTITLRSLQ